MFTRLKTLLKPTQCHFNGIISDTNLFSGGMGKFYTIPGHYNSQIKSTESNEIIFNSSKEVYNPYWSMCKWGYPIKDNGKWNYVYRQDNTYSWYTPFYPESVFELVDENTLKMLESFIHGNIYNCYGYWDENIPGYVFYGYIK